MDIEYFVKKKVGCVKCSIGEKLSLKVLGIYFAFLLLMVIAIFNKHNMHADETYSYGLSNYKNGIMLSIEQGSTYEPASLPYMEYFTVKTGEGFDYANVWKNQENDVHPPLYYVVLHTICSVFSDKFSIWFAGSVNILFALLVLWILRKIVVLLTEESDTIIRDGVSLIFIFSSGILSAVTFLRMYILAMFWVTLITYLLISQQNKKSSWRFYAALFCIAVSGALTHYYCIVFTVLICVVYGMFLLIDNQWKSFGKLFLTGMLSGATAYGIFPAMIKHLFSGYRGKEALDNLKMSSFSGSWNRLKQFYNFIDKQLFGSILGFLIIQVIIVILFQVFDSGKKKEEIREILPKQKEKGTLFCRRYLLITIPTIAYFLIVAKMASYAVDRYMFPIYAVSLIFVICMVSQIVKKILTKNTFLIYFAGIAALITVNSWKDIGWPYLYKESVNLIEKTECYSKVDCLYIYDATWKAQNSFYEISNYKSITFVKNNNLKLLSSIEWKEKEELIVIVIGNADEILNKVQEAYPLLTKCDKVGSYAYATTYYLHGNDM